MVDKRRDKTAEIPASTIAELLASRKRLAPRQETVDFGAGAFDKKAEAEDEQLVARTAPRAPIPREEIMAAVGEHLEPFSPARRLAFLQAFEHRQYARAVALLEEDAKRQPK